MERSLAIWQLRGTVREGGGGNGWPHSFMFHGHLQSEARRVHGRPGRTPLIKAVITDRY